MHAIGIFGDTGMVGGQIEMILQQHDQVVVAYKQNSQRSEGDLSVCELAFLATHESESLALAPQLLEKGIKVIDMSTIFRVPAQTYQYHRQLPHPNAAILDHAVYGMPALFSKQIANAMLVANPGCYATAAILALRPLLSETDGDLIKGDATIFATSGITGARKTVQQPNEATYSYGRQHKHIPEMTEYLGMWVDLTPTVLESVERCINMNIKVVLNREHVKLKNGGSAEAAAILRSAIAGAYAADDLVFVAEDTKDLVFGTRHVNRTHCLLIKANVDNGAAYICSMLDNLGKGAASQAVENMNIMLGLPRLHGIGATYKTSLNV